MALVVVLFCQRRQISISKFGDLICAAVPIGLFFGRIANFVNGELYGRQTNVSWAMIFPNGGDVARHPSQLYECALEGVLLFGLIFFLIFRFDALRRPGLVAGCFFLVYGISRYVVEFVREPDSHLGFIFGFVTMGQLLSIPVTLIGVGLICFALKSK